MTATRTTRSSAKRPAPRKRRSIASVPVAVPTSVVMRELRGRLVNGEEKRELILAHAAMRVQKDPVQMLSMWAGVTVAFLFIIGGWAWAFAPSAYRAAASPAYSGFGQVVEDISNFGSSAKDAVSDTSSKLDSLSSQVDAEQQVLDRMAASLGATSTAAPDSTPRPDLFKPSPSSTQPSH